MCQCRRERYTRAAVVNIVLTHVENTSKRRASTSSDPMWIGYPIAHGCHRRHRHTAMALRRHAYSALLMPSSDVRRRDQPARTGLHRIELAVVEMLTGPTPPIAFLEPLRGRTRGVPAVVRELVDAAPRTTRVRSIARRVATATAVARDVWARPVNSCRLALRQHSNSIMRTDQRPRPASPAARSGRSLLEHSCRFPAG